MEPGQHSVTITRSFDAPRELVFKAFTDPKHIPNWWGPRKYTTIIDKMEAKSGGEWRFVQHDESGNEFAFHGVFHEVKAPERVIQTFEWEGMPGHVLLETMTLEEQDGKTNLTVLSVFQTVEDRDGMYATGAAEGGAESYDRLDELLASL
jgi:uncharacterized protein YndB with AHSA1/START domain